MLPPIFPSPTSPISMRILPPWTCRAGKSSGEQAARHQQVLEAVVSIAVPRVQRVHSREYDGLRGRREGQLDERGLQCREAVEQELRVEAGGEVLAGDARLDRLAGHRLLARAGVQGEDSVSEGHLDRGVALGDQGDPLDGV